MPKLEEEDSMPLLLAADRPPVDVRRLVTVGLVGAVASMALYYFYNMLHEDARERIRDQVTSLIKVGIQKIALD